jgi:rhodanese-related sulfurtransferase
VNEKIAHMALYICIGIIICGAAAGLLSSQGQKTESDVIREFYETENVVSVSPSDFLNSLKSGNPKGLLVDLRSKAEYETGHFVTAVNIPAGEMDEKQLVLAFQSLPKGKPIINYCYSQYCMLSRQVGKTLAEKGIYAKHLTAGWLEIKRDYSQFIVSGAQPGDFTNEFGGTPGVCSENNSGTFKC